MKHDRWKCGIYDEDCQRCIMALARENLSQNLNLKCEGCKIEVRSDIKYRIINCISLAHVSLSLLLCAFVE